jgi:hypothetical protein
MFLDVSKSKPRNKSQKRKTNAKFELTLQANDRFFNKEVPTANPLLYNSFTVNVEQFQRISHRNTEVFHHF